VEAFGWLPETVVHPLATPGRLGEVCTEAQGIPLDTHTNHALYNRVDSGHGSQIYAVCWRVVSFVLKDCRGPLDNRTPTIGLSTTGNECTPCRANNTND
jgi:hypothetical protein